MPQTWFPVVSISDTKI